MNDGYIKLFRKTLDNPVICKDSDHLSVWVYLLLNATHKELDSLFNNQRVTLKPGQLITGRKSISTKLGISESKVQRIIKLFKSEHQIEQQTSNKNRLITILNWTSYQFSEQENEQRVNNKRTASEQRVNTNKNDKNVKNDKNDKKKECMELFASFSNGNEELNEMLNEYYEMRKEIKKPLSERATKMFLSKLKDIAKDEGEMIKILQNSIMNSWQGIFPLEKNKVEIQEDEIVPDYMANEVKTQKVDSAERQALLKKLQEEK